MDHLFATFSLVLFTGVFNLRIFLHLYLNRYVGVVDEFLCLYLVRCSRQYLLRLGIDRLAYADSLRGHHFLHHRIINVDCLLRPRRSNHLIIKLISSVDLWRLGPQHRSISD